MLIFLGESAHCIRNWWIQFSHLTHFPQKLQASKYWFLQCSNILIGKFEIGRGLFENFGKLEDGVSKFSNIPIFGRNQMNEPMEKATNYTPNLRKQLLRRFRITWPFWALTALGGEFQPRKLVHPSNSCTQKFKVEAKQ